MDEQQQQRVDVQERARGFGRRLVGFARRRPIVSLGLLAGAGALGGVEWAAGAVLGLAAAAFITTPAGRDLRQRMGARARHLLAHDVGDDRQQPA